MGLKRSTLEFATRAASWTAPRAAAPPDEPGSIFVLRNNDIGDLLVVTPLFEALKRKFPQAKIIAGIGLWNYPVLKGNPYVDEILPINAPWHNSQTLPHGFFPAMRYINKSEEVAELARRQCDIGVDVLGSAYGSLLLMRGKIPFRLGVRGYAGGDSAAQRCVVYDEREHVGRAALRFAELLGATDLPENRPQLFPWPQPEKHGAIVIAPGGSHPGKCWPLENYIELARMLVPREIKLIGGEGDREAAARIAEGRAYVENLAGALSLEKTFRLIGGASMVICNSSMAMHAAAAFYKPCYVLLGGDYPSASAHAAQWGHAETRVLGRDKDKGRREIWSPVEVSEIISTP